MSAKLSDFTIGDVVLWRNSRKRQSLQARVVGYDYKLNRLMIRAVMPDGSLGKGLMIASPGRCQSEAVLKEQAQHLANLKNCLVEIDNLEKEKLKLIAKIDRLNKRIERLYETIAGHWQ